MSGADNTPEEDRQPEAENEDQGQTEVDNGSADTSDDSPDDEQTGAQTEVEKALEAALEEAEKFKDAALRAEAEMQNVRRRAERDVENAHKYGIEKFLASLFPVVDSLEKAVEAVAEASGEADKEEAVFEGVKLCLKMFHDVLAKEKVEIVDPHGEPFDPQYHEAITMIAHDEMEPNSVVTVVQKGYKLNERLVRPAMVVVSKAADDK